MEHAFISKLFEKLKEWKIHIGQNNNQDTFITKVTRELKLIIFIW